MLRKHARSASGLCTDRRTHGTHSLRYSRYSLSQVLTVLTQSGTHVCPQSVDDDRPKLRRRHGEGAVELFARRCHSVATAVRTYGCAAVRAADSTAGRGQHSTAITAEDRVASHRVASHRVASHCHGARTCLRKSSLCSSDVAVRSLRKSSCSGTIGSDSGSDAIM
jgi:hypothetical protein